jgi:hypothetical protein
MKKNPSNHPTSQLMTGQIRMHKNQEQCFMHINQQTNWASGARKKLRLGHNFLCRLIEHMQSDVNKKSEINRIETIL